MPKKNRYAIGSIDSGSNIEFSITIEVADHKIPQDTGYGLRDVVLKSAVTLADQSGKQLAGRSCVRHNQIYLAIPIEITGAYSGGKLSSERVHMSLKRAITFSQEHRNSAGLGETGGSDVHVSVVVEIADSSRVWKLQDRIVDRVRKRSIASIDKRGQREVRQNTVASGNRQVWLAVTVHIQTNNPGGQQAGTVKNRRVLECPVAIS